MNMRERCERAEAYRKNGANCAQALLAGLMLSAFRLDPVAGDEADLRPATPAKPLPQGRRVAYQDGVFSLRLRR